MIPRLQRFYRTSSPEVWLHMRPAVFWAHVHMMPRLEAEESLGHIQETAAGSGVMDEQAQRELNRGLVQTANPERKGAVKATRASLAEMGIQVVGEAE